MAERKIIAGKEIDDEPMDHARAFSSDVLLLKAQTQSIFVRFNPNQFSRR